VFFGNDPSATAPAQRVAITDQLNPTLFNLNTLVLGPMTFPGQVISPPSVPLQSLGNFSTQVDLRPTTNLLVNVTASLNPSSGVLSWVFQSLDPSTGLPAANPLLGFLPPGGNGATSFLVQVQSSLTTGAAVTDQATIVFDNNSPIPTSVWSNTIDVTPPTSQVNPLAATQVPTAFPVSWTGSDVGAGVQDFIVYVSDNGAPFTAWQTNTTAASALFTGAHGHTYAFYSIARDLVGNVENSKTLAEATARIVVVTTPPVIVPRVTGTVGNNGWYRSNVTVSWNVNDPESGIASSTGCTTATLTANTPATILTCAAVNGAALSNSASVTIKIDLTPPVIVPSVTGQLGANGWYIGDVTVAWIVSDPESGIATSTGCSTVLLNAYTAGTTVSCSATNGAGLTSASSVTVKVDEARIHTLNPTASNSFSVSGADIVKTSGEIVVNSSSTKALVVSGAAKITAKSVQIVGGFSAPANAISPTPVTGVASRPDPFATMPSPSYSGCNFTNFKLSGASSAALTPGVYCGGITISGAAKASLGAGTYILNGGGLTVSGSTSLTGQGVTIYNTSNGYAYKPISFSGANTVNLSAPTSGPMNGVLFFQDRNVSSSSANTFSGAGRFQFSGTLYFPTTALVFSGADGLTGAGPIVIVANTVDLSGAIDLK